MIIVIAWARTLLYGALPSPGGDQTAGYGRENATSAWSQVQRGRGGKKLTRDGVRRHGRV
jgi:hypothetical protein